MNDFNEENSEKRALSVDDRKFIDIMKENGKLIDSHHCLPLPQA